MKVGARVFKTGIAIVLALYLAEAFHLSAPVLAGISAIFAVQPTIYKSYMTIIDQVQANFTGAIIAITFVLLFGNSPVVIGLAAIIGIVANIKMKNSTQISLSLVTMISIMEQQSGQFLEFAFYRFSTIMLGILSAFVVNLIFLPPKYETKLFYKIDIITDEILRWIRITLRNATEHKLLKNDIHRLKDDLIKADQYYLMYKDEREYFKKHTFAKSRKLVIYRSMMIANKRALDVLRRLHRYENDLIHMPEHFQVQIQQQLDYLMSRHEQVQLKFIDKLKTPIKHSEFDWNLINNQAFLDYFLSEQRKSLPDEEHSFFHMMTIVSAIMEYGETLLQLEKLINSFKCYHKAENDITIQEQKSAE